MKNIIDESNLSNNNLNNNNNKDGNYIQIINEYYDIKKINKTNEDTKNFIDLSIKDDNLVINSLELSGYLDLRTHSLSYDSIKFLDCSNNYFTHIICSCSSKIEKFIFQPNPIEAIKFPSRFDELIDDLPDTTKIIIFSRTNSKFNRPIDNLPSSLEFLETGYSFNQPVNCLPVNLMYLIIGCKFHQSINCLPIGLKLILRFSGNKLTGLQNLN